MIYWQWWQRKINTSKGLDREREVEENFGKRKKRPNKENHLIRSVKNQVWEILKKDEINIRMDVRKQKYSVGEKITNKG